MFDTLALIAVLLTGLYFVGLAAVSLAAPARAAQFLLSFAGSAFAHYIEISLRMVAGSAFLLRAPYLPFPDAFAVLGWVLIITSAGLLAIPWRWHQRFAQKTVPHAVRHLKLIAGVSLAAGVLVLASVVHGGPA